MQLRAERHERVSCCERGRGNKEVRGRGDGERRRLEKEVWEEFVGWKVWGGAEGKEKRCGQAQSFIYDGRLSLKLFLQVQKILNLMIAS